jgi:hypothetical protein
MTNPVTRFGFFLPIAAGEVFGRRFSFADWLTLFSVVRYFVPEEIVRRMSRRVSYHTGESGWMQIQGISAELVDEVGSEPSGKCYRNNCRSIILTEILTWTEPEESQGILADSGDHAADEAVLRRVVDERKHLGFVVTRRKWEDAH